MKTHAESKHGPFAYKARALPLDQQNMKMLSTLSIVLGEKSTGCPLPLGKVHRDYQILPLFSGHSGGRVH